MPIAGAVVVPAKKEFEKELAARLNSLKEASVQGIGAEGIAVILEADDVGALRDVSEAIRRWEEAAEFHLVYVNCEDAADSDRWFVPVRQCNTAHFDD